MLRPCRAAQGISLIEVLVALVIASLGLLTLVALQAASLRYTQVSTRRAEVTLLAEDLIERLRATTSGSADLTPYEFTDDFASQTATAPSAPPVLCDQGTSTCTVAQMAAFDLYQWRKSVREKLPNGAVRVALAASSPTATASAPASTPVTAAVPLASASTPSSGLGTWKIWIAWRNPKQHQSKGTPDRPADECPLGFNLNSEKDATVRCLSWWVRR